MDVLKQELENVINRCNLQKSKVEILAAENRSFGFIGEIINVRIEHEGGVLHLKVKIAPEHVIYRNQLMAKASYANEIYFYTKVLETLKNFQLEKTAEIFIALPKFYGYSIENKKEFLILEDLHIGGFVNKDSKEQITDSELKLVLLNCAKLHATSLALKDQKREVFDELSKHVFKNLDSFNFITQQISCVQEQCEKLEPRLKSMGVNEDVLMALRTFSKNHVEIALGNFDMYRDNMCCIIHGDSWNNNIMIKYDKDDPRKPTDLRIIDFQAVRLGSVIEDLSYFMFTSCDKNQLEHLNNYLKYYHDELSNFLIKLGSDPKIFPFETLIEQWRKHCHYGLSLAIVVLHGMQLAVDEFPNPQQVLINGEYIFRAFNRDSVNEQFYLENIRNVLEFAKAQSFI